MKLELLPRRIDSLNFQENKPQSAAKTSVYLKYRILHKLNIWVGIIQPQRVKFMRFFLRVIEGELFRGKIAVGLGEEKHWEIVRKRRD